MKILSYFCAGLLVLFGAIVHEMQSLDERD